MGSNPRHPRLFASLLAASTALAGPVWADVAPAGGPLGDSYPEVGGWGQAWGEDEAPPPRAQPQPGTPAHRPQAAPLGRLSAPAQPARPLAQTPPALPVANPAAASAGPPLSGESEFPEVGSWGQAWGEDEVPAAPVPRSSPPATTLKATPTTASSVAAPQASSVGTVAAKPVSASMPAPPPRIVPRPLDRAAQEAAGHGEAPVLMEADQVIYDREYNVVTAKGRVVMRQTNRTITADTVSYNLKQDLMGASGNVVMTEPTGEITFADYFEITGDFKNGIARDLRLILSDNSRLAAQMGQRIGGDRTDFDRVVYTACEPCANDPERTPIWAAKAARVTHNQAEAQVEYRDAWIEVAGVPVLYTPYISHPDPTVRRKSGFLAPTFGVNSKLGASVATPYFLVASDNEDLTLTPRFMAPKITPPDRGSALEDAATSAMQHLHLSGEHRWQGVRGEARTTASITADRETGDIRGHIESKGMVELDRTWRTGWQVQHQSDETYRTLYKVRSDNERPWLMTRPYVEGFGRRNYAMMESMLFEGHKVVEDNTKSPVVLPHMVHSVVSDPGWAGGYWTFDSDFLSYTRTKGVVAQRLSERTAWNLPVRTPDGQLFTFSTSVRADGYNAQHLDLASKTDAATGRVMPEMAVTWRYPFARTGTIASQVIEPVATIAVSPNGGNSAKIPNEDSLGFELDETNVLKTSRPIGLDRVEGGIRGGYGLRWTAYPARGGRVGVQLAQGWRRHADSTFGPSSGFTDTFSDYLGRVDVVPVAGVSLTDRVRLDKTSLEMRRNETSLAVGPPALHAATSYVFLSSTTGSGTSIYPRRQYMAYSLGSNFSEYWQADFALNQDLAHNGGTVGWTASATYNDECFAVIASMNRYFTTQPGLLSGYNAMLTVVLKTLGEAPVGLF
jgi:LPS-assembly protein